MPSSGVFSGDGRFVRTGSDVVLLADDLFIGGGLIGGLFFGLAGTRGSLKTVSFLEVTTTLSLSALMEVSRVARLPPGTTLVALTILRSGLGVLSGCISFSFRLAIDGPGLGRSSLSARIMGGDASSHGPRRENVQPSSFSSFQVSSTLISP